MHWKKPQVKIFPYRACSANKTQRKQTVFDKDSKPKSWSGSELGFDAVDSQFHSFRCTDASNSAANSKKAFIK